MRGWSSISLGRTGGQGMSNLRAAGVIFIALLLVGCSRGAVKGPVGQGEQGIGMKIPVLSLLESETYDASNFTPDNLDSQEVNPFREDKRELAAEDDFTRYRDNSDWY